MSDVWTASILAGLHADRNAKTNLTRWLRDVTYKGEREYGVFVAFIIVPEPGVSQEPRV